MLNLFIKSQYSRITFFIFFLISLFLIFPLNKGVAQVCSPVITEIRFSNDNRTTWQVEAVYYNYSLGTSPSNPIRGPFRVYVGALDQSWEIYRQPIDNDKVKWFTACVDPVSDVNVNVTNDFCRFAEGKIYRTNINISCRNQGAGGTLPRVYAGCGTNWDTADWGNVPANAKCPGNGECVWGGTYWGACNDYCGGNTPRQDCERIKRSCTSSGCNRDSTFTYAAVCNDPNGPNDGGNRCAPNPPGNRTDSAFCQGPAGTDRAAGINMNWDAIPFPNNGVGSNADPYTYDLQLRQVGGGDLHTWDGNATQYSFPGNGCTSGPGGCSLPYNTAYEWRVRGHTSNGRSGPTDWSAWNPRTTNNCQGKPDLRVTGFSFQGGNSAGTTDAVVTIINSGYSGTGGQFDVKVNNGNGQSVSIGTNALGVNQPRTVTVPNVPRPNAGSYTATAIVDPKDNGVNNTDDIDEVNETNNTRDDPYNTTSNVGGTIFIDDNPTNGTRDAGEGLYTSSINIRVGGVNYTGTVGTYKSGELDAGTYNVTMPTVPMDYTLTTPDPTTLPVQRDLGPNRTVDFGLELRQSNIIIDVFEDYDGNGAFDATAGNQDKVYPGATITVTGQGAGTYTTNASGRVTLNNLNPGNSNITLTVPGSYTLTTPTLPAPLNAITITVPPTGQTVNFGLQPPVPYCAGGLTANPSSVTPGSGVTSALTCVNPTSPNGDPLSYNWPVPDVGTVDNVNLPTSTWRSPISTAATSANPSVTVCYQGTNRCRSHTTPITLIQRFTITGNVYIDENENGIKDLGESNYTGNVTITATPVNGSSSTDTNGAYTISNLPASSYTISYTDLPGTYRISYPQGLPPSFTVTVGSQANCTASIAGYNSATCTNGSISNLNFGIITNAGSWIQSGGSDIWFNNGLTNSIPSGASCQSYASLAGPGGTPGIVYSGIGSADFGSGQASANPYNWKVGGISSYSESYGPASSGSPLATSYTNIKNLATTNGTPPTSLTTSPSHCGAGGIASCNLSPTLASGVYEAVGNLTLANNYAFPANRNYVILVRDNLRLNGTIDVPVGSTVLFSVQGNIYVSPNVGTNNVNSNTPHLEGWFSTDHSFYVEGGNTCPTRDNRLNVEGAIIVNASLQGGSFYNDRDLCSQNSNCPVFYIKERPDFALNAPRFLKNAPRVYKEVAP